MQVGEQQTKEQEERYKFLQQENKKINFPEFMLQQKEAWEILKQEIEEYQKKRSANLSSRLNRRWGDTI